MAQYKLVDGKRELVRRTMPAKPKPAKPAAKPKPEKPAAKQNLAKPKTTDTDKEAS